MSLTVSPIKGGDVLLCNGFEIAIVYCEGMRFSIYRKGKLLITFSTLKEAVAWCEN